MKRAINKIAIIIIAFFFNSVSLANNTFEKRILELNDEIIKKFSYLIKTVCTSKILFKNLESHNSFPDFGSKEDWRVKCNQIPKKKSSKTFKEFILKNFEFKQISNFPGLLTGYYEPIINVSHKKNELFKFPILKKNAVYNNKTRSFIERNFKNDDVILWTDNSINLFFLHIQGSGIGEFEDGKRVKVKYDGNNGLSYTSIGKILIKRKYLKKNNVNLFTIKDWLKENPKISKDIMNLNERFIFFSYDSKTNSQPTGSSGAHLLPNYSIAVDKKIYPLGLPIFIDFLKDKSIIPSISLDTGAAIVGPNRADLFLGQGRLAEQKAGILKEKIFLITLIPRVVK